MENRKKFFGNQYVKKNLHNEDELIQKIQELYDSNFGGIKKIAKELHIGCQKIVKWKKEGLLKMNRTKSEMLSIVGKGRKLSKEIKDKISKSRKDYLLKNPDKVPYKLNHYSKGESYPEQYFREWLIKENISF